jgi:YbgC/YbaW family acyl-CoA thioester hydrolase
LKGKSSGISDVISVTKPENFPKQDLMGTKVSSYPILIKEVYLDSFGHVNNAIYLTLFEEARWDIITKNNYGLKKIHETGLGPIILEIKLNYFKELRLREEIIIETQILSYQEKIGKLSQKMLRNNEVCCTAEIIFGLFNLQARKLVLPTTDWLNAIGVTR